MHYPLVLYRRSTIWLVTLNGRIAFEQRHFPEALAAFEEGLARIDQQRGAPLADLRLYAAESLVRAQRLSEAEYLFLEELKRTPLAPRALAGLSAIYKATGRTDEAAALVQY